MIATLGWTFRPGDDIMSRMGIPLAMTAVLLGMGCKGKPEAPEALDELASFLFEHVMDEEDDYLLVGVENLNAWLAADFDPDEDNDGDFATNFDATADGYSVTNLSVEAVKSLDGVERNLDDLLGGAVGYNMDLTVEQINEALIRYDMMEVFPDKYQSYERTFADESDRDCFLEKRCDRLEFDISVVVDYPLNLTVDADSRVHYRRVTMDDGSDVVLQRTWMLEPGETTVDWIELEQQYFLAAHLVRKGVAGLRGESARRIDVTWVKASLGNAPVPEDMAISLTVDTMRNTGADLEAYYASE